MDKSKIDALRQQVEDLYQEQSQILTRQREDIDARLKELAAWKERSLEALSPLPGEHWLTLPGSTSHKIPAEQSAQKATPRRTKWPNTFVQADEIRKAINALRNDISIVSVRNWIQVNNPEAFKKINSRSIRTLLWRMDTEKKLKFVRTDGNAKVYDLVEERPIPSGDDSQSA